MLVSGEPAVSVTVFGGVFTRGSSGGATEEVPPWDPRTGHHLLHTPLEVSANRSPAAGQPYPGGRKAATHPGTVPFKQKNHGEQNRVSAAGTAPGGSLQAPQPQSLALVLNRPRPRSLGQPL